MSSGNSWFNVGIFNPKTFVRLPDTAELVGDCSRLEAFVRVQSGVVQKRMEDILIFSFYLFVSLSVSSRLFSSAAISVLQRSAKNTRYVYRGFNASQSSRTFYFFLQFYT